MNIIFLVNVILFYISKSIEIMDHNSLPVRNVFSLYGCLMNPIFNAIESPKSHSHQFIMFDEDHWSVMRNKVNTIF